MRENIYVKTGFSADDGATRQKMKSFLIAVCILVMPMLFSGCDRLFAATPQDFVAHYSDVSTAITAMFDDCFFIENYIIYFTIRQPSTALNYRVESVMSNGDIIFAHNMDRGMAGDAITHWTISIELDNNFAPDRFRVVFPDPTRRWSSQPIPIEVYRRDVSHLNFCLCAVADGRVHNNPP